MHAPLDIIFLEDKNKTLEKNGAKNLGILRRIVLNILKFIQCYYNKMSLKLIRFDISMDVETGLEKVFKLLNTEQIKSLLKENTWFIFSISHAFILIKIKKMFTIFLI